MAASNDPLDPFGDVDCPVISLDELRAMCKPKDAISVLTAIMNDDRQPGAVRVNAARTILGKNMPDLRQTEVLAKKPVEEMADAELATAINELRRFLAASAVGGGASPAPVTAKAH